VTWTLVIVCAALGLTLSALAGFAKSCMDTIVFRRAGFDAWPANLRAWMLEMRSDAQKWRDGWHVCQMVWHLAYGLAFYLLALAATSAACLTRTPFLLTVAGGFAGAWALRLIGHHIGFTRSYPVK
jgi:hypothetical protein